MEQLHYMQRSLVPPLYSTKRGRCRCWMLNAEKDKSFLHQLPLPDDYVTLSNIRNKKCVSDRRFFSLFTAIAISIYFQLQGRKKRMKTNHGRNCRRKEDICVNLENRCSTTTTTLTEDLMRNWLGR